MKKELNELIDKIDNAMLNGRKREMFLLFSETSKKFVANKLTEDEYRTVLLALKVANSLMKE